MKKIYFTIVILLMVAVDISQAQLATDSWSLGFGFRYPRFVGVQVTPTHSNYGGFLSLQRNFSENFGLRFKGAFSHMEGEWLNPALKTITESTNLLSGDLDFMFYLIPCEAVSPYLFGGVGGTYRMLTNKATASFDDNATGAEWNFGFGVNWALNSDWKVVTEFGYHATSNSELDGFYSANGNDSYWTVNIGLNYFFAQGNPSKMCEPCPGGIVQDVKDVDYNRIEAMIVKHIPKEITKEVVVDRYIKAISDDRLVLIGVNFAFDKSDLLPESFPVLDKAVDLLNDKKAVNVEIEGYCDYIGTVEYNQKLSVERAQTVKSYLVSKGINENRLSTIGYGKSNPIADNETVDGRSMNRRIVFRILK
jgi:outer membrane protein OmpA-like peptidoglycan-associated protein